MRAEVKRGAAGRDNNATAALRHRHLPSADLVRAGASKRGGASRKRVEVGKTSRESRLVISVEDSDLAKGEVTHPGVEVAVPAERFEPDPADKAAKPGGELIRIARVHDLESLQRN